MSRSASAMLLACVLALLAPAALRAQIVDASADEAPPAPSLIETYLEERNLTELLAAHLLERLKITHDIPERTRLADRLGSIYVQLLEKAATPDERQRWEERSQELIKAVPEADSFELRLNLAKALYLKAEDQAERHRLRLATPEERQESEQVLRSVVATFADIGAKVGRRVDALEKDEQAGKLEGDAALRHQLSEGRRLRSLAMYYAGWCNTYLAFLSARPPLAEEALTQFGWLLNAGNNREANIERVPEAILKYEHVARAAIGAALCESLRSREINAIRWLDTLERTEGVPETVTRQLFSRRIIVLSAAKRWNDLSYHVEQRRKAERDQPPKPLDAGEARLLAVVSLEALQDAATRPEAKDLIQSLADAALTDLVTLGEVRHVQDIVTRYGSANLGGEGFIVQYVRAMQNYDRARAAHAEAGENPEEPTAAPSTANLYRDAATGFASAIESPDSQRFPSERATAGVLRGLSFFYAGDLTQAADTFEEAFKTGGPGKSPEDALWLAIVSLDKAIADKPSVKERLIALTALYIKTYPRSDRAAKLLLRQVSSDVISEDKAIEILLGVDKRSPLYEAARRQAASILYNVYRRARGPDKDFAALRFAEVTEELLNIDRAKLSEPTLTSAERTEAITQIITRVRQVLDAVLGMTAPDLDRADRAFEVIDSIAGQANLDMQKVEDELTYRRLQVALARARVEDINKHLDRLHAIRGRYADAADRLMYKRALVAQSQAPSAETSTEVVRHGLLVIDQFSKETTALADPAVYSLYNAVAEAASRVATLKSDKSMLDISLRLDKKLMEYGNPPAPVLRRYAHTTESIGQTDAALEAWRLLVAGLAVGAPEWYEARYNGLRLLALNNPAKAREGLDQHKLLNPDMGPEPWGSRLKELDLQLPAAPASSSTEAAS